MNQKFIVDVNIEIIMQTRSGNFVVVSFLLGGQNSALFTDQSRSSCRDI